MNQPPASNVEIEEEILDENPVIPDGDMEDYDFHNPEMDSFFQVPVVQVNFLESLISFLKEEAIFRFDDFVATYRFNRKMRQEKAALAKAQELQMRSVISHSMGSFNNLNIPSYFATNTHGIRTREVNSTIPKSRK